MADVIGLLSRLVEIVTHAESYNLMIVVSCHNEEFRTVVEKFFVETAEQIAVIGRAYPCGKVAGKALGMYFGDFA